MVANWNVLPSGTELDEGLLAGLLPQATGRWLQAHHLVAAAWQYLPPWHQLQLVTHQPLGVGVETVHQPQVTFPRSVTNLDVQLLNAHGPPG